MCPFHFYDIFIVKPGTVSTDPVEVIQNDDAPVEEPTESKGNGSTTTFPLLDKVVSSIGPQVH